MSKDSLDIAIAHFQKRNSSELETLIESLHFPVEKYQIEHVYLGEHSGDSYDVIFAELEPHEDLMEYTQQVSTLKLVCHIPIVIGVVPFQLKKSVEEMVGRLPADMLLTYPVKKEEMQEVFSTLLATHEIENRRAQKFRAQKPLGTILVESSVITAVDLSKALEYSEKEDVKIGEALIELGIVPEERMVWFLAAQMGVTLATTKDYSSIDSAVVSLIPESFARHNLCIPLSQEEETLSVIVSDPKNLRLLDRLRDITGLTITPLLGSNSDILQVIDRLYKKLASTEEAEELFEQSSASISKIEKIDLSEDESDEKGIIRLVTLILENAVSDRASDIHIEPREHDLIIRFRIDGELHKVMTPPLKSYLPLLVRLKIMANLDIAERRVPQDGRFVVQGPKGDSIDARLSILPTIFGEKAVIRLLHSSMYDVSLSTLGLSSKEQELLQKEIYRPYGLVVITGPTGSGKTTTLYAILKELQKETKNIISVEDPVEYTLGNVSQVQVNNEVGLTFPSALRSILRQDPDIIMVGEIRDAETADIAIKMALTGHLVFATLHTNDAASAITRLINIGISPLLLASCLNLVVAQRLVKRICPNCKEEMENSEHLKKALRLEEDDSLYHSKGCVACHNSGFSGRVGIYEMLPVTALIEDKILQNSSDSELKKTAQGEGMQVLFEAGVAHLKAGITSFEQIALFAEKEIFLGKKFPVT